MLDESDIALPAWLTNRKACVCRSGARLWPVPQYIMRHLGDRSMTFLYGMSAAGKHPPQHIIELPKFCIALPACIISSPLPHYQTFPHALQVALVSVILHIPW